jgi:hypothetical protein
MAFFPDPPNLCKVLSAFGPWKKNLVKEETAKKNAKDVRKSLMTLLSPQFENELEVDDIENMRC